ncbi:MAG TPA: family 43 glycosylhydrolase [Pyrinomonadaceae bacterium]|nr:family 43 glycosylhydrolase [Pyrinomonadaceae bacterium]
MEDAGGHAGGGAITLTSQAGAPFPFTVTITVATDPNNPQLSFKVTGVDPVSRSLKTRDYHLAGREHKSYTQLFGSLARDFGCRPPRKRLQTPRPASGAKYRPLITKNLGPRVLYGYGDPAVLSVRDNHGGRSWYYLLVTSNDAPESFPIIRSPDLVSWELVGFVFPEGRKPKWAVDGERVSDYWAPEMHFVGGEFRVYFVARDKNSHSLSIGVAKSAAPEGPFAAAEEPLLSGNVIDPHLFVEDDGAAFLYWKEDNNDIWPSRLNALFYEHPQLVAELFPLKEDQVTSSLMHTLWPWIRALEPMERFFVQHTLIEAVTCEFSAFRGLLAGSCHERRGADIEDAVRDILRAMKTPVYARRVSPDGASLVGERTKVIENDQVWEAHLIEGVWLTKQRGRYYLFYAGNDFSTDLYGVGVAIADSPLGPFRKMAGPLLGSTADWHGPGHPSVATGPEGEPLLFLHAFFPGRTGYKEFRALLAVSIAFEQDRVLLR